MLLSDYMSWIDATKVTQLHEKCLKYALAANVVKCHKLDFFHKYAHISAGCLQIKASYSEETMLLKMF